MKLKTLLTMVLGALVTGAATAGDLAVSAYWQDHMVLQRGKPITVWGKDAAGRAVTVSFAGQTANATTGSDGFWETTFAQPFALSATPQTLTISNDVNEVLSISDILVGDVFLAAGQSNMDRRLEDLPEPQSIKDFCRDDDGIRFIRIARSCENSGAGEELFDLPPHKAVDVIANPSYHGMGHDWSPATGDDRNYVSSDALNFAHYIRRSNEEKGQNIPIGIIHASSGGTAIRWWMSNATLSANGVSYVSNDALYWNVMMAPIKRAKFRAVLWYQGCSDDGMQPNEYKALMDILVKDRRDRWGENGDLPFYAVQIGGPGCDPTNVLAPRNYDEYPSPTVDVDGGPNYVRIREAQRLWDLSDTGTHGLVTIVDCVDCLGKGDLHPKDKNFVGRRLSLFARRDLYGEPSLQAVGPVYTRAVREANGTVRVFFKSGTAKGLTAGRMKPASSVAVSQWVKKSTDPIRGFALCGADGVWQDAEATVDGETIVLRAEGIATPTKFHYGYWNLTRITELEDGQRLNLYNESGLPMSPVAPQTVEDASSSAKVADPVLLPASCYFSPSTNVTISCATSGATIRYTLDGSEPTATSTAYTAPIALAATTTVKARAFAANKDPSDIVFATYTLGEAPAPDPNPQWTNGAYDPSAWAPLGENLLASATASHTGNLPGYASQDMGKLTDGKVPVNFSSDEVVGFGDMEAIWTFAEPKTIGKIRISSRWSDQTYANIGVNDVYVLKDGVWVALGVPDSHRTGVSSIPPGSLMATLEDDVFGYLAQNVDGLKISFNKAGANVAQYYAEIEAIAPGGEVQPAEMVATPTFNPASCSFFPSTNVALSCATAGATIRYTLDGSNPTSLSTAYEAPIALSATTTIKARAYATDMSPSAVASATYTLVDPVTPDPGGDPTVTTNGMWATSEFSPSAWSPLANNLLRNQTGTLTGNKSYMTSDIAKITDGTIPVSNAQVSDTFGLAKDATIDWTFDGPKTLEKIRFTTCYVANSPIYDDIKISKIEVKTSGSESWTDLGVESVDYAGSGTSDMALSATLEDTTSGFLAQNVTALRITFGQQNNIAQYYAEIEAVGTASGDDPNPPDPPATYDITITAPQNGTLETSVTNDVAAGTTVTVTATPAEGCQLVSVTTNGAVLAGNTFTMPSANVTVAATFEETEQPPDPPPSGDKMFYIGETGYDSWADAYAAAANGDTIVVGTNAVFAMNGNKQLTIDLAGRALEWSASGWMYGSLTVVDTAGGGQLALSGYNRNVGSGTVDLSSLAGDQLTGSGKFYSNASTVVKFPGDMSLADCTSSITFNPNAAAAAGVSIVVQGATYRWDGTEWVTEGYDITIAAPQNGTLETSATNNVAAGTTVTVTATPASGYQLVSVTTNGTALAGNTFTMPSEDVTVAATFEETATPQPSGDDMFYIGDTGYDSWTNAFEAATNGATIVVGTNAVIVAPQTSAINKDLTIDLNGHDLNYAQGWLTGCTVAIVDSGTPSGSGLFRVPSGRMNISGGTLDLSALSGSQVVGNFQMSFASILKFPGDLSLEQCTSRIVIDPADATGGVGARIVVQGVTYVYDGKDWGVAFKITSIAVYDDVVEFGVMAPETGSITITGSETVNGTYDALKTTKIRDGLYQVPVSASRFFKAALDL